MNRTVPFLAVLLIAATAHAQRGEARGHFERGVELMEEQECAAAVAEFERANALDERAETTYNLGVALACAGRIPEAFRTLERFLESRPRGRFRVLVEREVERLRAMTGRVVVDSDVAGARVSVDGEPAGTTPLAEPLVVTAGRHAVLVESEDRPPRTHLVSVEGGGQATVSVRFLEAARVQIRSLPPGGRIVLDDQGVGSAPWSGDVPEGEHRLRVELDDYAPYELALSTDLRETTEIDVDLYSPREGLETTWFYAGIAATGASAVLAIVFASLWGAAVDAFNTQEGAIASGDVQPGGLGNVLANRDAQSAAAGDFGPAAWTFFGLAITLGSATVAIATQTQFQTRSTGSVRRGRRAQ